METLRTALKDPLDKWSVPVPLMDRISVIQRTTLTWTLREAAEAFANHGFKWFGARIDALRITGLAESRKILDDCGLSISSIGSSGHFVSPDADDRERRINECFRAIDDAAAVDGNVLVIVAGTDVRCSREDCFKMIEDGIAQVLPHAEKSGVVLGLEPLHPMFAADKSIVITMSQAMDLLDKFSSPYLRVMVDTFHTWWDPELYNQIRRARGRICGFHVNDWVTMQFGISNSRGMIGDGMIPLRKIRSSIEEAGYFGPIDIEIFNEDFWHLPCEQLLCTCIERYKQYV